MDDVARLHVEQSQQADLSGKGRYGRAAIEALLMSGKPKKIHVCCVIAAPEGIEVVKEALPEDSTIWCAAIDEGMNEHKYIVPGFGDCGDLCFGEKLQSFRKKADK